jgi:hypothetical protein
MKASRAYIAGLGTTGVLLAFALLLLVVVSAIVAFRGWPAGDAAGGSDAVRIDDARDLIELPPVQLGTTAAAAAAARGDSAGGTARPGAAKEAGPDVGRVGGVSESGASAPAQPGAAPVAPAAAGGASAAPDVTGVANGVAETTRDVTEGVAGALGGVDTQVEQSVSETGDAVSGLVQEGGAAAERQLPKLP